MPFNRKDLADLTALRDEVLNNAAHYGDPGTTPAVLAKLNTRSSDPTVVRTPANSNARDFDGLDLAKAVMADPTEFAARMADPASKLLIETLVSLQSQRIPTKFKSELVGGGGVFNNTDAPTIRGAIVAEATGPQSMAEVMFGDDTNISRDDWFKARDLV